MGNKVTFSELNQNCCRMAHVFEKLGAKKGDRISFMTHNCLQYIYSWLGACKIGCVVNPLNFMLKPNEIEYIVNDAGSRFFFVEDMLVPQALEAAPNLKSVEKFGVIRINAPDTETPQGWVVLDELFASESDTSEPLVETDDDDMCSLMYTSGTPHTGVEMKIFDDDEVLVGEMGEIVMRGPSVMKGYYNLEEKTAETLRGGWLHAGDLGKFDEEGFLYFLDRKKDMINSGGENVASKEVEDVLYKHEKVMQVAVIGPSRRVLDRGGLGCRSTLSRRGSDRGGDRRLRQAEPGRLQGSQEGHHNGHGGPAGAAQRQDLEA